MEMVLVLFLLFSCTSAGPVAATFDSCVVPTTQVCSVTYLVPPSIAQMAPVLEAEITAAYNSDIHQGNTEQCALSLQAVRCAKSFPRCSNDSTQVTVTSLDCNQRLKCATSQTIARLNAESFCSLAESTVSNGGCKSATDYGYTFSYCAVDSSWLVSEWMFLLLKYEDTYLSSSNVLGANGFLAQNYPSCSSGYAGYECRKIGQCDSSGHVSINFTSQQCEQAVSCYPSGYVDSTPCSVWPQTTAAATTVATSKAPTAAKQRATTIPTGGTIMLGAVASSAWGVSLSSCVVLLVIAAQCLWLHV